MPLSSAERAYAKSKADPDYYDAENRRWPALAGAPASEAWAHHVAEQLSQTGGPVITVEFTDDPLWNFGWAGEHPGIQLTRGASWLTLAHEIAHARGFGEHDEHHRNAVDLICKCVTAVGWPQQDTEQQFEDNWPGVDNLTPPHFNALPLVSFKSVTSRILRHFEQMVAAVVTKPT